MRTCDRCGKEKTDEVGGEYGTKDFEKFCSDCWETIKFEYEEHKKETPEGDGRMKTTKTVWGWVWSGGLNDMRAQAKDSMCATKDDARAEADEFADREFGDEPRGDLGLMEFCTVCWEPTGKCECAE